MKQKMLLLTRSRPGHGDVGGQRGCCVSVYENYITSSLLSMFSPMNISIHNVHIRHTSESF